VIWTRGFAVREFIPISGGKMTGLQFRKACRGKGAGKVEIGLREKVAGEIVEKEHAV